MIINLKFKKMKKIVLLIGLIAFVGGGFIAYSSINLNNSQTIQVDGEKCPNCGKENCNGSCKEHKCSHQTSTEKHSGCQKTETTACCKKAQTSSCCKKSTEAKSCCKKADASSTEPKSCCKKQAVEEKK
jgi:hypothetical protein